MPSLHKLDSHYYIDRSKSDVIIPGYYLFIMIKIQLDKFEDIFKQLC